ncbi:ATP-binding cassette domain-containing protein [Pedobacter nototheniae]|uniref:ATP-binding cassette domain-containing protein n=1 Tax=Pedobacter nototheniae TaxID=2488994 RepID=UPI00293076D6|nr:ATP-binding cassette domain-containing protein [Pedobacter nototheniae]
MQELHIDSVTQSFNNKTVLNGVFLNCRVGEVTGLLGRNGSGKSTLLKVIFGVINPHFKYLRLNDKIIDKGYLTGKIAYLPQDNFIPGHLRISKAINLFCNRYKDQLLKIEAISNFFNSKLYELSGGQRRLMECLLIIYSDADFILLDEPFSQLSPLLVEEIQKHLLIIKGKKGIIVTDHYYRSILNIADRIVLLHNGCNYNIQSDEDLILHGYLPNV